MGETFVRPSELHLKKEISVLRKARFLRDPDTCSSWRSPLASRSAAAHSNFSIASEGFPANNSSGFFDVDRSPNLSLRKENPPKKVYLYNWGHHYSKSSDTGVKLGGDDKKNSPQASPDGSPINLRELDSKRGKFLDKPIPDFGTGGTGPVTTTRRNARKFRRPATAKHRNSRDSASPKLLDISLRPPGILDSMEQSDGSEDCNSEDLHLSTRELIRRTGYASSSTSPFLSGSGCGNWSCSSRILKNAKKEESSCSVTPASTSSFNRYGQKRPSTIGSWDGTTASFDGDEARPAELSSHRGHAASRYSSKRVKDRGCGGWYSPSLSDTLRRKGSSILCGSQNLRHKRKSAAVRKQKLHLRASQGLPLLTNGCDEDRSLMGIASDALSTSFGELELEALSRLDGKRWSHCGNQEGLVMPLPTGFAEMPSHRSLSQKYRPRSFGEIIGQNIIVHSLQNAILRRRIAPAYLFHGSHGTGKTSTARIFAGALNCLSTGEKKPCGFCRECTELASGNGTNIREVVATNKRDIDRIRNLLKNMHELSSSSSFKIFIVDECHILSSKVWSAFIKFLEEPPSRIVFVFITVDPDNLPRAILSRCQKYLFSKIKEVDIVSRLRRLSAEEGFDVELDALDLIALNSDGSLSDAETMLDQLGLLGKTITSSLVHDLVGVVSEEKLIDLLEIAMSSDTAETVRRSRELMDSGVDPVALMSQLAGLIMDIIAGTYRLNSSRADKSVLRGQNLADAELERLQQALKILSDAEKQLRLSSERSTWFTAALLQLGSDHSPEHKQSSSGNSKRSPQKSMTGTGNWGKGTSACKSQPVGGSLIPTICGEKSGAESFMTSPEKLKVVWQKCIEKCHSRTLRQLLSTYGRLISIFEAEGVLVVSVAFNDEHIRARAEGYLSSITNSMEIILGHHVQVRIGSALDDYKDGLPHFTDPIGEQTIVSLLDKERKLTERSNALLGKGSHEEPLHLVRKRSSTHERKLQRAANTCESSQGPLPSAHGANAPQFSPKENDRIVGNEDTSEMPRIQTLATDEQRLESAWLQTMEKGTTGLVKPERNQILPQNGSSYQHQNMSKLALGIQSNHWDDELNHEIKALKINDTSSQHKEEFIGKIGVISPSLLHRSAFNENFGIQNPDFESGPDCNGLLCFRASKPGRRKVKQRTRVGSQKAGHLLPFGRCMKTKTTESSFRR